MTIDSVLLNDSTTAVKDINRVLSSAIKYERPVYIELPRDIVLAPIHSDQEIYVDSPTSNVFSKNVKAAEGEEEYQTDITSLKEAVSEATTLINSSNRPVIIAGVEIQTYLYSMEKMIHRLQLKELCCCSKN